MPVSGGGALNALVVPDAGNINLFKRHACDHALSKIWCASQLLKVEVRGYDSSASELPIVCNVHACDEKFYNTPLHWALTPDARLKNLSKNASKDVLKLRPQHKIPYAQLVAELLSAGADPFLENGSREYDPSIKIHSMRNVVIVLQTSFNCRTHVI